MKAFQRQSGPAPEDLQGLLANLYDLQEVVEVNQIKFIKICKFFNVKTAVFPAI